ncbi:MAG: hypothetical protein ABIA47_02355 [bacterium]
MSDDTHIVVCCHDQDHVFEVEPGSHADREVGANNYLAPGQCPECNEERRDYLQRSLRTCAELCARDLGIDDGVCADGCAYALDLAEILDDIEGLQWLRCPPACASA